MQRCVTIYLNTANEGYNVTKLRHIAGGTLHIILMQPDFKQILSMSRTDNLEYIYKKKVRLTLTIQPLTENYVSPTIYQNCRNISQQVRREDNKRNLRKHQKS